MRVTLLALGTRGDTQPAVALGRGLKAAGHDVTVAINACYAYLAEDAGLRVVRVNVDSEAIVVGPHSDFFREGRGSAALLNYRLQRTLVPYHEQMARECWEACRDAEVVVFGPVGCLIAQTVAEKLGIPIVMSFWAPYFPTETAPAAGYPPAPAWLSRVTPLYNRLSCRVIYRMQWLMMRHTLTEWRRELGLRPLAWRGSYESLRDCPGLFAYSQVVAPRPPDWPERIHVTGFWFLPSPPDWKPPADLANFLAAGEPPVAIALGSMYTHAREHYGELFVAALRRAGRRGILVGWDQPPSSGADIFALRSVPFPWLFPHVSAVVHHGGAGTTAETLHAGKPAVVVPLIADQPWWADQVHKLGVAAAPIRVRDLTVERLSTAIQQAAGDDGMRQRAVDMGQRIAAEDGVGNAVRALEAETGVSVPA